ncbi:MAG: CAP domain-containing protein [Thermoguttaceae bacterium]
MTRRRRIPHFETLETREMLSGEGTLDNREILSFIGTQELLGPNAQEQEMLELINRMRLDPQGELNRLIKRFSPLEAWDPRVSKALGVWAYPSAAQLQSEWSLLSPAAPLAWNNSLAIAANAHNVLMQLEDTQSHQIVERGEAPLFDRVVAAGFEPYYKKAPSGTGTVASVSENIYAYGLSANSGYTAASYTHAAFAIDWGVPDHAHRDNIMDPNFTDVGISMLYDSNSRTSVGPWLTTVDFGAAQSATQGFGAYLVGVVFNDVNGDGFYQSGEGVTLGTITVNRLDEADSEPTLVSLYQAGGYQVFLENGSYSVTMTGPQFRQPVTKYVTVNGSNVKVDFTVQNVSNVAPVLDLNGPEHPGVHSEMTYKEGSGTIRLIENVATLIDVDSTRLTEARIILEQRPDGLNEYLLVDTSGTLIKSVYDSKTGLLRLTGDARVADYLKVLKTLEYGNVLEKMSLSERTVRITVSDGVNTSNEAVVQLDVEQTWFETLTVTSQSIEEGDVGVCEYVFWLDLSDVPRCDVRIEYVFGNGTGQSGTHFFGEPGTLIFSPNQTRGSITVSVPGNYKPDSDRDFTLQLIRIEGAVCDTSVVTGVILDDDTPRVLGEVEQCQLGVQDLSEGRRVLYSFSPKQSGRYTWESLAGFNQSGSMELLLFEDTHEGTPVAQNSSTVRARLEFELEQGQTYILMLRADIVVQSLNFAPPVVIQEQPNQVLEVLLDPAIDNEVLFRLFDQTLEYNGIGIPWTLETGIIQFINVGPEMVFRIVAEPNEDSAYQIDLSNPILSFGPLQINTEEFREIVHEIRDPSQEVEIQGTAGDDSFEFFEGGITLESSLGQKHLVLNARHVRVDGGKGVNRGLILDTPFQDSAFFESDTVRFYGGGDTNYEIELRRFSFVDVSSVFGGYDILTIVNEKGNQVELGEYSAIQTRINANQDILSCFFARGFVDVSVDNRSFEDNTIRLDEGKGTNFVVITPGRVTSTNSLQTYFHAVYGGGTLFWNSSPSSSPALVLMYESQGSTRNADWECQDDRLSLNFPVSYTGTVQGRLDVAENSLLAFYFEGQLQNLTLQPFGVNTLLLQCLDSTFQDDLTVATDSPRVSFNSSLAIDLSLRMDPSLSIDSPFANEPMIRSQSARTRAILFSEPEKWFADDLSWVPFQQRTLSLAELAFYFEEPKTSK